jgi:hypothetical protein
MSSTISQIKLLTEGVIEGHSKARACVFLVEEGGNNSYAFELIKSRSFFSRAAIFSSSKVTTENYQEITKQFEKALQDNRFRHVSLVAWGGVTTILVSLALINHKLIRTLILIDPSSRAHPSRLEKIIDKLEERLPLGLPLRKIAKGFDCRPFLQRVRSPTLVINSNFASDYLKSEAQLFASRIPTAWKLNFSELSVLAEYIDKFQEIPAKCPQSS